jgi:hypothetical protein
MRVLFCHRPGGAWGFITDGMINALRDVGCVVERWDGKLKTWDTFAPDVYIGASGHRQPVPILRTCKIAIHVNPYGPIKIEPNINESQDAIDWVQSIHPDVVFGYGHETDRNLWSFWDRANMPWIPIATAGDVTLFNIKGTHNKYDVGYVGGRWPYKAKNIDAYLLPVLRDENLMCDVYGWGVWPDNLCKGHIEDKDVPLLYANCRVAPCISEPHTLTTGIDLPERVFKAILAGAVVVHDPVIGIDRYLPHVIIGNNPKDYYKKIAELMFDDRILEDIAEKQYDDVITAHTYHHRMATLMRALNQNDVADRLLLAIKTKWLH